MALSNTLVTNEIKNASGTEVEFFRLGDGPTPRSSVFAQVGEAPALIHRLTISHIESGSGIRRRRRSVYRFDKTVISTIDLVTPVVISKYDVVDLPIGAMAASTEFANVIAEGMSFGASLGASTTILYDCTGNGAAVLLGGGL
jgi:hypothetical protein